MLQTFQFEFYDDSNTSTTFLQANPTNTQQYPNHNNVFNKIEHRNQKLPSYQRLLILNGGGSVALETNVADMQNARQQLKSLE
jgi:hypothetical protein